MVDEGYLQYSIIYAFPVSSNVQTTDIIFSYYAFLILDSDMELFPSELISYDLF